MYGNGDKLKGEKNGMYGIHRYGELNPMFGKRGKDSPNYGSKRSDTQRLTMSIAALNRKDSKTRAATISNIRANTKYMTDPAGKGHYIKEDLVEQYLQNGWILGKPYK